MSDAALAALRALRAAPVPRYTAFLAGACFGDLSNPRGRAWAALVELERAGLVRRLRGRGHTPGRPVRWEPVSTPTPKETPCPTTR